jgi:transmembrane sensor
MQSMKTIDRVCARAITHQITPEEKEKLDRWLLQSPENQNYFDELAKTWERIPKPDSDFQANTVFEWGRFEQKVMQHSVSNSDRKMVFWRQPSFKMIPRPVLAGLAVLLCILAWQISIGLSPYQTVLSKNGQTTEVTLSDGTRIRLNAGSKLQYPKRFSAKERQVKLTGEAFFQVKQNGKSFVVSTKQARTIVLGTKFDVWARKKGTRVIVTEGSVRLASRKSNQNSVEITQGQMSRIVMKQNPETPVETNTDLYLGWLDGKLIFDKTSLREAIAEIERTYDVSIKLDASLATRLLTAQFKDQSIDTVLAKICLVFNAEYRFESGKYVIRKKQ